ncbi:protein MEMO1-like [Liolophura sinensis]|uniref:protein MEMO1-like n=1 Tax=Liolophura sinensis TaxID=3198878 RepID=UPI0031590D3F
MAKVRRMTHAGSWYTDNPSTLNHQLENWLSKAPVVQTPARAIIAPHAGYSYCGACGGHAYKQVDTSRIKRVFILGPSHHARIPGCSLTTTDKYQTPLFDLPIDTEVNAELYATGAFDYMRLDVDEDEHSIEMHLPYVAKIMEGRQGSFKIVPILVGSLSTDKETSYGRILSNYLANPENFFVISSDFCHWGRRFHYTFYDRKYGEIWKSIKALDEMGMEIIERLDPVGFSKYLGQYQNTICGRHPIGVLLNAVDALRKNGNKDKFSLKFVKYAQSSQCCSMEDSSVSYASGALVFQ